MTTINSPVDGNDFDEEDDDLVSLTSIFNAIQTKLHVKPLVYGDYLRPGEVNVRDLYVSRRVQRLISTRQIDEYGKEGFRREYANYLIVAIRPSGRLVDIDGQHTAILFLAATASKENDLSKLPCLYIDHPPERSLKDCLKVEADIFYALNTNRKDPNHVDKMKAGLAFGKSEAVEYNDNLVECGVYIEGYDYLGDSDGSPMVGEYQWRQAISKFGVSIVSKACAKLIKLQEHDNWKYPGKTKKKIDTAIRSDMVIIIATLYQFIKDVKVGGGGAAKLDSLIKYVDEKLTEKDRKNWYEGISGSTTGLAGALRIIKDHNSLKNSTTVGNTLLKKYNKKEWHFLIDDIIPA